VTSDVTNWWQVSAFHPSYLTTEWDAAFLQRTVLPILFALLTLFAFQFPGAGNTLLNWLRPMQTALP
jgi:hypothetical protein